MTILYVKRVIVYISVNLVLKIMFYSFIRIFKVATRIGSFAHWPFFTQPLSVMVTKNSGISISVCAFLNWIKAFFKFLKYFHVASFDFHFFTIWFVTVFSFPFFCLSLRTKCVLNTIQYGIYNTNTYNASNLYYKKCIFFVSHFIE